MRVCATESVFQPFSAGKGVGEWVREGAVQVDAV